MTINFEKEYDKNLDIDYETIADKVINAALDYEKCPYEAEVSPVSYTHLTLPTIA